MMKCRSEDDEYYGKPDRFWLFQDGELVAEGGIDQENTGDGNEEQSRGLRLLRGGKA